MNAVLPATELPHQPRLVMAELEPGDMEVGMRPIGFEPIARRFDRLTNRLVLGIIAVAPIIGRAMPMSV